MRKFFLIIPSLFILMIAFQNCTQGFESNTGEISSIEFLESAGPGVTKDTETIKYTGLRPLTKVELENNLSLAFTKKISETNAWDSNILAPFDNFNAQNTYGKKRVDKALLSAEKLANSLLSDKNLLSQILPCSTDAKNLNCLKIFISKYIPLFFRGLEDDSDIDDYNAFATAQFTQVDQFDIVLSKITRAILLDPKFLYRKEEGKPTNNGSFYLNDLEYLNKLTFFLLGRGPSSDIIDQVKNGYFSDKGNISEYIEASLASNDFLNNTVRFHSDWLGFGKTKSNDNFSELAFNESSALIKDVYENGSSWFELFTSEKTYINNELASNYKLPTIAIDKWRWVDYKFDARAGILSHASFLSLHSKAGDTNPIMRGYHMTKSLFCGVVAPPPKSVDVDEPPPHIENGRDCKIDRIYANTTTNPACSICHRQMEAIGFGLENFDIRGRWIAHEEGNPKCDINTKGKANMTEAHTGRFINLGDFDSPKSLSEILVQSGQISRCLIQRLIEFDTGSKIENTNKLISKLEDEFKKSESLKDLIRYYVTLPEYRLRK